MNLAQYTKPIIFKLPVDKNTLVSIISNTKFDRMKCTNDRWIIKATYNTNEYAPSCIIRIINGIEHIVTYGEYTALMDDLELRKHIYGIKTPGIDNETTIIHNGIDITFTAFIRTDSNIPLETL